MKGKTETSLHSGQIINKTIDLWYHVKNLAMFQETTGRMPLALILICRS